MKNLGTIAGAMAFVAAMGFAGAAQAQLQFDQDVTPDTIFGSGNSNGGFTTSTQNGVEIGLRAKIPFTGLLNSGGDGSYDYLISETYQGSASTPNAWSVDFTVNTDITLTGDDSSGPIVGDFTYEFGVDSDPGPGAIFFKYDPFILPLGFFDHAFGNNLTANGAGVLAVDAVTYAALVANNNVVQQSWRYAWTGAPGYNPNIPGNYRVYLQARNSNGAIVARSDIQVLIEDAAAVTAYTCNDNSGLFDAPMDKAVMVKKKNQTLPLKMICVDAGENILGDGDILPPFVQVTLTEGTADPESVTETGEILFTGKGTDGNEFVFDPDTGVWQFNLKTKNFSAAGIYEVTAGGTFGINPTATFTIK